MKQVVSYLMSGPAHLHYLIPSLFTLRMYWAGDIELYAYPESYELVNLIARDHRLDCKPIAWIPSYKEKNSQFLNKILMCQSHTADVRVYLDADTTVHGPLTDLFDACKTSEMNATQFNNWVTTGRLIRKRVERLRQFPDIDQSKVEEVLTNPYPSPNGGIFSVRPESSVLSHWYDWSWMARKIFICDESVLQVLQRCYLSDKFRVLEGGRWNCSHKYGGQIPEPVIYHYHGNSCTRPQKSPKACAAWWPIYEHCIRNNLGSINSWRKKVINVHMERLKTDPRYSYLLV